MGNGGTPGPTPDNLEALMRHTLVICATLIALALIIATSGWHARQAETDRIEYCTTLAPYASVTELTACLNAAHG